jgi:type II secretory pathway component PulJ
MVIRQNKWNNLSVRRGITLIEVVVATSLSILVFSLFWSLMRQSSQSTSRMNEVMKLMDGASIQARIDEDI